MYSLEKMRKNKKLINISLKTYPPILPLTLWFTVWTFLSVAGRGCCPDDLSWGLVKPGLGLEYLWGHHYISFPNSMWSCLLQQLYLSLLMCWLYLGPSQNRLILFFFFDWSASTLCVTSDIGSSHWFVSLEFLGRGVEGPISSTVFVK